MDVKLGDQVGNYRLIELLGRGGMGRVFAGEHTILRRRVAIKVLRADLTIDARLMERLFDEARAASRVDHPAIVEIFDCGLSETAGPYIVMEYLDGESLWRALRRRPLPPLPWAVNVLTQVAEALDAVHAAGIVHRDLKPGNLFLRRDGRLKILDFGVACLAEDDPAAPTPRPRRIVGTPHYMAPEQTYGGAATPAVDIYALGIIAFTMLTGTRPYRAKSNEAVFELHRRAPVPSASRQNTALPRAVDAVFSVALAKRPEARYATCHSFVAALLGALEISDISNFSDHDEVPGPDEVWPRTALAWLASDVASPPGAVEVTEASVAPYAVSGRDIISVTEAPVRPRVRITPAGLIEDPAGLIEDPAGLLEDPPSGAALITPEISPPPPSPGEGAPLLSLFPWLRCPQCEDTFLTRRDLGAVAVDTCDVCRGVWLDAGELAAILSDSLGARGDASLSLEASLQETTRTEGEPRRLCPACGQPMTLVTLLPQEGGSLPLLDRCDHCRGIWVDAGELAALQRWQAIP